MARHRGRPSPRPLELFQEWFDTEVIDLVLDAGVGPLDDRQRGHLEPEGVPV
jgi:hypothetical protein